MQYSIELKNVCKTYPGFALKNVSFQLPKGSIMGFIGMNGAGKSTTMKSILNMVRPQSGEITVLGLDPAKNEEEIKHRQARTAPAVGEENVAEKTPPSQLPLYPS